MFEDLDDLCKALADKPNPEKRSMLGRCIRRYFAALRAAEKFGFVGVGCITFAENRLIEFQRRVYGFKHKVGETVWVTTFTETYEAEIAGYGFEQVAGLPEPENTKPVYDLVMVTGRTRWAYREQIDG